jgi:hypothetical protein
MGAEDAQMVVESQAQTGVEPTYCMGDDIPLAVLSDKPHMLYDYFKQRFAQVRPTRGAWLVVCARTCSDRPRATPGERLQHSVQGGGTGKQRTGRDRAQLCAH